MTLAEAIETTRIHRVAVHTGDRMAWVMTRPCRAPRSDHLTCRLDRRQFCKNRLLPLVAASLLSHTRAWSGWGHFLQTVAWVGTADGRVSLARQLMLFLDELLESKYVSLKYFGDQVTIACVLAAIILIPHPIGLKAVLARA
jgi:hypothetical protein